MSHPFPPSRQVFDIPELRQCIICYLPTKDLLVLMAVSRRSIENAAGVLYHTVPYYVARDLMKDKKPTKSQRIYCEAVRIIRSCDYDNDYLLTRELLKGLGLNPIVRKKKRQALLDELFTDFRSDVFNVLIPPFRHTFPRLRKMNFSSANPDLGLPRWVVHFDAARPAGPTSASPSSFHPADSGHIDRIVNAYLDTAQDPPKATPHFLPPPSPSFGLRTQFDVAIRSSVRPITPSMSDKWRTALHEDGVFAHLHRAIEFDELPIDLSLLASLYQQQIDAGHGKRLYQIRAHSAQPWNIRDFQAFSAIASTSLGYLLFANSDSTTDSHISFDDLHMLISTIQTDLPNLRHLRFNMAGVERAEKVCLGMLDASTLERRGSLFHLSILTADVETPIFNILRSLMPLMSEDGKLTLPNVAAELVDIWGGNQQRDYQKYLRKQSSSRRAHLSTVDFPSIGIMNPRQLRHLTYGDDDRPIFDPLTAAIQGDPVEVISGV